jgi:hypothetical protein
VRGAALAGALLAIAGCGVVGRVADAEPKPGPQEGAWAEARRRFTRDAKLYDGLTMRAFATVIYDAPEVRAARVDRVAAWKAMTPAERAALESAERAAAARFEEFTVSLVTGDRNDNDLDSPRTAWRVALVPAQGPESLPVDVEQVPADALLRTLYPRVGDFDVVYRVRFARVDGLAPPFALRMAGPRGRMEFAY